MTQNRAPAVMIYRRNFLPVSETFVADHVRHLQRWVSVPACVRRIDGGAAPAGYDPIPIHGPRNAAFSRLRMRLLGEAPALAAALARVNTRLVHAHFLEDGAAIARFAARQDLPLVVTAHGYDATIYPEFQDPFDGGYMRRNQARLARSAAAVICVSEFIRRELAGRGYPEHKLVVNPLGILLDDYRPGPPASRRRGVLFAGRLVEKKGAAWLLRAWALLPESLRGETLTVIGGGVEQAALQALARELGIAPVFLGAQSRAAIREAMLAHRVFAFPSLRAMNGDAEGMGVVAMEAQALGMPVLAFDDGPAGEVVSAGRTGLLAPPRDAVRFSQVLADLLSDDALADRLGAAGPAWIARRFDLRHSIAKLEGIYDRIASGLPPA